jgi:hypothetical protein
MSLTVSPALRLWLPILFATASLIGCQAIAATPDDVAPVPLDSADKPHPQPRHSGWSTVVTALGERARTLGIQFRISESPDSIELFLDTRSAFIDDGRELSPEFTALMAETVSLPQTIPAAQIRIAGFGEFPATRYNPVTLGLRVRRLRSVLANEGFPVRQIRALVKDHQTFTGPEFLAGLTRTGRIIELRISPR